MTVLGSNTTDATIINLMPSTLYIVQVAAINDAGDGVYSDPLTACTSNSTGHSATTTVYVETTAIKTGTVPYSETMTRETPTGKLCHCKRLSISLVSLMCALFVKALFLSPTFILFSQCHLPCLCLCYNLCSRCIKGSRLVVVSRNDQIVIILRSSPLQLLQHCAQTPLSDPSLTHTQQHSTNVI